MADFTRVKYFRAHEFQHPERMDQQLIRLLDDARAHLGKAMIITSSWRPEVTSSHNAGKAVDIRAKSGAYRLELVKALLKAGALRIGVYDRHIHVDVDYQRPTPTLWSGVSL